MNMGKKKVAILLPWLKMGGTNKVALRFIRQLVDFSDVTLILSQNIGELRSEVPDGVNIIIDEMKPFKEIFQEDIKKFKVIHIIKDLIYYARVKTGKDSIDNYKYLVGRHGFISNDSFDCAISYHGQSPERLLNLIYRVNADKKVAWIHGKISFTQDECLRMEKYYRRLDHFYFVSGPTMEAFIEKINVNPAKCTVYYNPLDKNEILQMSDDSMDLEFNKNVINILTVGRISSEKGQDMVPAITRRLLDNGFNICWYLIGDGGMRPEIEKLIVKYNVQDNVILLGTKTNPYCFMKNCDIYVQPSYTEGYSTTICEAAILGKAIIGTSPSGGIKDQITDGNDGLIVDATINSLTNAVMKLIENEELRHTFERNIIKKNFSGDGEIKKFISFLNTDG